MIQYICTRCRNEWWGGRADDPDEPEPRFVNGCPKCQGLTQKALALAIYAFIVVVAVYVLTTPWR